MEKSQKLSMDEAFLQKLSDAVFANLNNDQFGAEDLSSIIGLSRSQVHRKLQKINGKSITQFIREIRLEEALKLLQKEVGTASEIAFMTGFSSHAYFTKCFHEYFGYPPGEVKGKNRSPSLAAHDDTSIIPVHRGEESVNKNSKQPLKRKLAPYFYLAALPIVIAAILLWHFFPSMDQMATVPDAIVDKSIVVLRFRNDSPDGDNEYFCKGMREEILTHLQKIKDIRVKSTRTSELDINPEKDLVSIAEKFNATFLLVGSVRKVGDNIRVYARLIDGRTGDQVWAEPYNGNFNIQILDFQTKVAKKIAASLNAVITPQEEQRIDNKSTSEIMAYDLYWRGLDMKDKYERTRDLAYIEQANELFDKALRLDPNHVGAIYGKGQYYLTLFIYSNGISIDSALIYADSAIKVDPKNEMGYALKGGCMTLEGQPDSAIDNYLKSIELNRNWNWSTLMTGFVYCECKNDYIHGIPYIEKAIKLEGRNPSAIFNLSGRMYLHLGDYKKAFDYYQKSIALRLNCYGNIRGYSRLLASQGKLEELKNFAESICGAMDCATGCARLQFSIKCISKDYKEAEIYFNQFIEAGGSPNLNDSVHIAFVYKKLGNEKEAMPIVEKIISSYENQLNNNSVWFKHIPYNLSSVHALLDEKKKALKYLSKAADRGLQWGFHDFVEIDPIFESLWDDPEFNEIVKKSQDEKAAIRTQIREMEARGELDL